MIDRARHPAEPGVLGAVKQASVLQGGVFFASRIANGALALLQVLLVTQAVGSADAGRFFLLWTGAWLLSVLIKFGADGIVPRAVAEARVAGLQTVSMRRVLIAGLTCGVLFLPVVMTVLGVPLAPTEIGLTVGLAVTWAAYGLFAALLKAKGRADLSGIVANVLWPLGPTLAPVAVIVAGGDWLAIAEVSLLASLVLLVTAYGVTARGVGLHSIRGLVRPGGLEVPVARDEVGAAVLTTLYEVVVWLPVLLSGVLGLPPEDAAGLFAASRLAGLFSWGYQAVITVLVPRIAGSLAAGDARTARRTLRTGSLAGIALTWPLCLVGIALAGPALDILGPGYGSWAGVLTLLILARGFDAATGPLGEALLVSRRTWVDVGFVAAGLALSVVCAEVLYGPAGDIAVGIAATAGFVLINILRLIYVGVLLREVEASPLGGVGAVG